MLKSLPSKFLFICDGEDPKVIYASEKINDDLSNISWKTLHGRVEHKFLNKQIFIHINNGSWKIISGLRLSSHLDKMRYEENIN